MKALTVKQPWAMGIINAGKDVENRSWPTSYRGPLMIHAGRSVDHSAYDHPAWSTADLPQVPVGHSNPAQFLGTFGRPVYMGSFIGIVDLVGCIRDSASPWAEPGQWHWVLENPKALYLPIPAAGKLGLWNVPADALEAVQL